MPTYDYRCGACAHRFEVFQSMSEGPKRKCPACGKRRLERLIGTGAGIIFKGSGFYETDYRSESYTKGAEADKATQGSGDDSGSGSGSGSGSSSDKADRASDGDGSASEPS